MIFIILKTVRQLLSHCSKAKLKVNLISRLYQMFNFCNKYLYIICYNKKCTSAILTFGGRFPQGPVYTVSQLGK